MTSRETNSEQNRTALVTGIELTNFTEGIRIFRNPIRDLLMIKEAIRKAQKEKSPLPIRHSMSEDLRQS